ncbi:NEDD8 ultimate buster 1like [Strongylocentrotus purpuratus] [Fasciola gigantica]|uniref:NEDD8 ultimate buster 1like [Strongylocentrotus purpuratus] n=1 Tax=Fasciola gigantica TaxID=46835 RepID=A0A504YQU0_FASGI|nr:NEDD8 ultimate buster 1like [Strongylocentrotus purpuratus] [Fasciola gigantica]
MPSTIISRKKLQSVLQSVSGFSSPKIDLEQYPTSPHVAADILFNMQMMHGSIQGMSVADLGCGPGILSVGARLLGASYVISVDVDPDAISDFVGNLDSLDMRDEAMDAVLCDVTRFGLENDRKLVDTVILNPPFGTNRSNTGIDMEFLKRALYIAESHVYSLHKTSTRDFVLRTIRDQKARAEVVAELRFDIPRMYKRHRQGSVDIEVDLVHAWY